MFTSGVQRRNSRFNNHFSQTYLKLLLLSRARCMLGVGHVLPSGPVWSAVSTGDSAHVTAVRAPAAGSDSATVDFALDLDSGQDQFSATAQRLHGLAYGGRDLPLALPGEL